MKSAALAGFFLLLGLVTGQLLAGSSPAPAAAAPAAPLSRADVAAVVRGEIVRERIVTLPALAPAAAPAPAERVEDAPEPVAHAAQIVDLALARGQWTAADKLAIDEHFRALSPDGRLVHIVRLMDALNRGELAVDFADFPI